MKTCPDCAEEVQGAARICKHCGYNFESGKSAADESAKSTATSILFYIVLFPILVLVIAVIGMSVARLFGA